jgi:hypothetical protein
MHCTALVCAVQHDLIKADDPRRWSMGRWPTWVPAVLQGVDNRLGNGTE